MTKQQQRCTKNINNNNKDDNHILIRFLGQKQTLHLYINAKHLSKLLTNSIYTYTVILCSCITVSLALKRITQRVFKTFSVTFNK